MGNKITRRTAVLAASLAVFGLTAGGAARAADLLHVTQTATINAPAAKVWSIVGDFSNLTWVPPVKSSTATEGNTVGSVRTLDLGGPKLTEQLTAYSQTKMRYSYLIQATPNNEKVLPVTHYHSTIKVVSLGANECRLTWTGYFKRADTSAHPQKGMDDTTATGAITGIYQAGLANVTKMAAQ